MIQRFAALLRACLALPLVLAWETCKVTGKLVLAVKAAISPGAVPAGGPDLVSDVGAAAEEALEELKPARRDAPSTVATVQDYCRHRLTPGKPRPRLDHLPLSEQAWLVSLTDEQVRTLYSRSTAAISSHVAGLYHVSGVPPVGGLTVRDPAPVDRAAIEKAAWDEVLAEIALSPTPRYAGV